MRFPQILTRYGVVSTVLLSLLISFAHPASGRQVAATPPPCFFSTGELDTIPELDVEVESYHFRLAFDFDESEFTGRATVSLLNPDQQAPNPLEFDASSDLLTIDGVRVLQGETLEYTHRDDILSVEIPFDFWTELTLVVEYQGEEGQVEGPFGGMGLWMTQSRAWTFFFPDGAHAVIPVFDTPTVKAPVTWELGVSEGLTAVANGYLEREWAEEGLSWFRWVESHPVCSSEMGLAVAEYTIIEAQAEPFPIRYYVYPDDSADAAHDFARVPDAVELFEDIFGHDYPFAELKIVECGVFGGNGGQEHQTMISLGHNLVTGNRAYESIVVHEIAHQWFADLVTPVHWEHFWLNEGFAVWAEAAWAEHLGDHSDYLTEIESDRRSYFNWEREAGHDHPLVNDDYDITMPSALPYQRGALAIHQLYMRYGPEDFTGAVGNYLEDNAYGHVCSEDLRDKFRETTGDTDLGDWFDQWIFRGEAPVIEWAANPEGSVVCMRQVFDHPYSPAHGLLYDCFRVTFGEADNFQAVDWPADRISFTWNPDTWQQPEPENPVLFPNLEVPARYVHLDEINEPLLDFTVRLGGEDDRRDNVLQPGEHATVQFRVRNSGLALQNGSWSLVPGGEGVDWERTTGELPDIGFRCEEELLLEIEVIGAGEELPAYEDFTLQVENDDYAETFDLHLATGRPEILVIDDGAGGVADIYGEVLYDFGIVWGTPNHELTALPEDMHLAEAVIVEADGRYAQYLWSGGDDNLLEWFSTHGGAISGQYLHQIWPNADPGWGVATPGEWLTEVNSIAFVGVEEDPISDGRNVLARDQEGISNCSPCCGNVPSFYTPSGDDVVGSRGDVGWRYAGFGFSLAKLTDGPPATMTRRELIARTAHYLLYREWGVTPPGRQAAAPAEFKVETCPNPFNPKLKITVSLPSDGHLKVEVFNLLGKLVAALADGRARAGTRNFSWDAGGEASGLYLVRTSYEGRVLVNRALLLK